MPGRAGPLRFFKDSLKSPSLHADEIINVFLLRPLAALVVWALYPTRVTPNQVTVASTIAGLLAALMFALPASGGFVLAGLLVTLKDVLDDADGQLARARQQYSRRGRFLDSIGDAIVDVALFAGITIAVLRTHPGFETVVLGALGLLGITLRVSYHVYYQVSYLHTEQRYGLNRIVESVTEDDLRGDPVALRLQRVFNVMYTWQDRLMYAIDRWCRGEQVPDERLGAWYADRTGLRLSGLLGFGTEFALLSLCAVANRLELYLLLNLFLMNGICCASIFYRKLILSGKCADGAPRIG
jgi:phosphatidylglycerophosphate synthase